jgi:hypothetical protein
MTFQLNIRDFVSALRRELAPCPAEILGDFMKANFHNEHLN